MINSRWKWICFLCLILLTVVSCGVVEIRTRTQKKRPDIQKEQVPQAQPKEKTSPSPSPQMTASLHLTEQGKQYLEKGKVEAAMRILERAISLHPYNGENYFYMAEAWLQKGNQEQATEFNRLAKIHFNKDIEWEKQVEDQKKRIQEMKK